MPVTFLLPPTGCNPEPSDSNEFICGAVRVNTVRRFQRGAGSARSVLGAVLLFVAVGHQNVFSITDTCRDELVSTGTVVALICITLATIVSIWVWLPNKFQADMGLLLAFMFG